MYAAKETIFLSCVAFKFDMASFVSMQGSMQLKTKGKC